MVIEDDQSGGERALDGDGQFSTMGNEAGYQKAPSLNEKQQSIAQTVDAVQEAEIKRLQLELNESRVKHGEEVYWLRLELDSSRREKEAAEDRTTELYHDLQEILEQPKDSEESYDLKLKIDSTDICVEPDYVAALHERLSAYEKSFEFV